MEELVKGKLITASLWNNVQRYPNFNAVHIRKKNIYFIEHNPNLKTYLRQQQNKVIQLDIFN